MSDDDLGAAVPLDGDRLDALERLAEKATPGPWRTTLVDDGRFYGQAPTFDVEHPVSGAVASGGYAEDGGPTLGAAEGPDAEFIAAADPSTVLALAAALRASWAEVERLTAENVCDGCEGLTNNIEGHCDACLLDGLERDCDRLRTERDEARDRFDPGWLDRLAAPGAAEGESDR